MCQKFKTDFSDYSLLTHSLKVGQAYVNITKHIKSYYTKH
jgi:hypothetical protein